MLSAISTIGNVAINRLIDRARKYSVVPRAGGKGHARASEFLSLPAGSAGGAAGRRN